MVERLHAILGDGFRWAKGGAVNKLPDFQKPPQVTPQVTTTPVWPSLCTSLAFLGAASLPEPLR